MVEAVHPLEGGELAVVGPAVALQQRLAPFDGERCFVIQV